MTGTVRVHHEMIQRMAATHHLRDDELIVALVAERTLTAAANAAGCSERTLRRRLKDARFRRRVGAARRVLLRETLRGIADRMADRCVVTEGDVKIMQRLLEMAGAIDG